MLVKFVETPILISFLPPLSSFHVDFRGQNRAIIIVEPEDKASVVYSYM